MFLFFTWNFNCSCAVIFIFLFGVHIILKALSFSKGPVTRAEWQTFGSSKANHLNWWINVCSNAITAPPAGLTIRTQSWNNIFSECSPLHRSWWTCSQKRLRNLLRPLLHCTNLCCHVSLQRLLSSMILCQLKKKACAGLQGCKDVQNVKGGHFTHVQLCSRDPNNQ